MNVFEFFDFLDQLLSQTPYATEILLGLALVSVLLLFFAVREFTYRYLKLHLVRQEIRTLTEEVKGLRLQISELKSSAKPTSKIPKDMDFVGSKRSTDLASTQSSELVKGAQPKPQQPSLTLKPSTQQQSEARPVQPGSPPPKFPLT